MPSRPPPDEVLAEVLATVKQLKAKLVARLDALPADFDIRDGTKLADAIAGLLTLEARLAGLFTVKIEAKTTVSVPPHELVARLRQLGLPVPPELADAEAALGLPARG